MKFISLYKTLKHNIISFLGIILKNKNHKKTISFSAYDMNKISQNNICVFFIPGNYINGGIMSIFTLCKYSRIVCTDYEFIISTMPGRETFNKYTLFNNDEIIYSWDQVFHNISFNKRIIFHIPEHYINTFVNNLSFKEKEYLSKCQIQINILNQNIKLMSDKPIIRKLFAITKHITQTTAHSRYATQKVCDEYGVPLFLFSTYLDVSPYIQFLNNKKEKIIIFSPDEHIYKEKIKNKIKQELPQYKILEPKNLPFTKYWETISKASYVITFGEGFDGYFNTSPRFNTISFSVYNSVFFPSEEWKNLKNCYLSYEDMYANIVSDIKKYDLDKKQYSDVIARHETMRSAIYSVDKLKNNLSQYYKNNPLYKPKTALSKEDLISVVVTCYNHEEYIEKAINSILDQVCSANIEILVGNDCSTDNTKEILEKYKKYSNIKIFNRKVNLGAQANLRDLLNRCAGDYIAILEGDDYWLTKNYLQKQYDALQKQEDALMSFTNFYILRNNKTRINTTLKIKNFMGPRYSLLYCRPSNFSCCMYRKKVLQYIPDNYWKNPKNFCAFFNFYVLDNGGACYISEPLMVYRCHNQSIWSSMDGKKQILQAIDSLYRLSIEIPNKYDDIILYVINNLTKIFNNPATQTQKIKNIFSLDLPVSKKKKYNFKLQKIKNIK